MVMSIVHECHSGPNQKGHGINLVTVVSSYSPVHRGLDLGTKAHGDKSWWGPARDNSQHRKMDCFGSEGGRKGPCLGKGSFWLLSMDLCQTTAGTSDEGKNYAENCWHFRRR